MCSPAAGFHSPLREAFPISCRESLLKCKWTAWIIFQAHGSWSLRKEISKETKITQYGNGAAGAVLAGSRECVSGTQAAQASSLRFLYRLAGESDGSLKGLRILGKLKLPYYDTKSAMNWMSFRRFQLYRDGVAR